MFNVCSIFLYYNSFLFNHKDCATPSQIANGQVNVPGETTYLSSAMITCNTGFQASFDSITCQENGLWTDASCVIIGNLSLVSCWRY